MTLPQFENCKYTDSKIKRYDIINYIIIKKNYNSYLEIGTQHGLNFSKINIINKECCDPIKLYDNLTYNMTSDEAFIKIKKENKKYDIIFIDGLHWSEQVYKDIINSLECLNKNGCIVLHDCNPITCLQARYPYDDRMDEWNGDCYKAFIKFRLLNLNMYTSVIDTDWGIGIIIPNLQNIENNNVILQDTIINTEKDDIVGGVLNINNKYINWDYFDENRNTLLNLISVENFFSLFI